MYLDPDQRTGSRNMGRGVVFKVRLTRHGFGAKVACKYKGWSECKLDPVISKIISQCDTRLVSATEIKMSKA